MSKTAHLVYPHQLFTDTYSLDKNSDIILIEDDLFCTQYKFHKQKLVLHRASMQRFKHELEDKNRTIHYIESSATESMQQLQALLKKEKYDTISFYDLVDDWLAQRLSKVVKDLDISYERYDSPGFLTTRGQIEDYFEDRPHRMQSFYEWQRKRLKILVDDKQKPEGGKWSYDKANRKKLPKNVDVPAAYSYRPVSEVSDAIEWVQANFPDNPGSLDSFTYPVTHDQALRQLDQFLSERYGTFGPYEDAISTEHDQIFHSVLSPLINIGLITPNQVVERALQQKDIPIESAEGFIRQVIGWREYMRAMYIVNGRSMRTKNTLEFNRKIPKSWWAGKTGLDPVDLVINRTLDTGYVHHIERLMILGNSMLLLRFDPDEVYEWFMSLFIDAYDWVMVPNVYAMSQFAAGTQITTKPYVSGSNYVLKMSDHSEGDWTKVWDALYWQFVRDYREVFHRNHRSSMMVSLYDKKTPQQKTDITNTAKDWLP